MAAVPDAPAENDDERRFLQARLEWLAAEQDGVAHLRHLRSAGLSARAVHRWAKAGRLYRLHRAVYAIGRPDVPPRGRLRAAVLAVDGSRLTHRSGAALWGFMEQGEEPVEVTVPGAARSRPGIRVHATDLAPEDITHRFGIPVTNPHRTILDLAATLPPRELGRALGQAEVMRLVSHPRLRAELARHPRRRGTPALAALIARGPAPTRSHLEDRVVEFLHAHGFTGFATNARVAGFEVDAYFPAHRLVVEADSREFHDTPLTRARDVEKQAVLEAAGYRVLRLRWADVTRERTRSAARISAALQPPSARRTSPGVPARSTAASR